MNRLLYIETSVPSFYFDTRTDPQMVARRQWTRHWWSLPKLATDLVIGFPVRAELDLAPSPKREQALRLVQELAVLPSDPEVDEVVAVYLAHKLMPAEALGDGHHLALASYHLPPVRYVGDVELQAHRQRQQTPTHPARQCPARPGDAARTVGGQR